jgi:hypothetical protein
MMRSGTELMIIDLRLNVNHSTGTSSEPQSNSSGKPFDRPDLPQAGSGHL